MYLILSGFAADMPLQLYYSRKRAVNQQKPAKLHRETAGQMRNFCQKRHNFRIYKK
jgi:hypothetical protein